MKKILALALAIFMTCALVFTGCAKPAAEPAPTQAPAQPAAPADSAAPAAPAATEEPSNVVADDKWSGMTKDELYDLAKKEGGTITVYTISSRMQKTCEAFMEEYPELKAEAVDLDQTEAVSKLEIEAKSKNINADILQCKDGNGEIYYDFYPLGYLETYYPTDICEHIANKDLLKYGMPFYVGLNYWYYNTAAFPNGAPISNWWDLVEVDANGKQKCNLIFSDLGSDSTYLTFYANCILHGDEFAKAYEEKYGKPLEYTYDASATTNVPENNAGYEFLYRLSQLKLTFIDDGDEIVEAVNAGTDSNSPTLGFCSAGKITNREDNGYTIDWVTKLAPFPNVQNCNYLYIVTGCDNQAGARLFIRYLMGEADGQGKGFEPFTKQGNWSIRDDYTNPNNPFDIQGSGAIVGDMKGVYDIFLDVQEFWTYWLDKNPNM